MTSILNSSVSTLLFILCFYSTIQKIHGTTCLLDTSDNGCINPPNDYYLPLVLNSIPIPLGECIENLDGIGEFFTIVNCNGSKVEVKRYYNSSCTSLASSDTFTPNQCSPSIVFSLRFFNYHCCESCNAKFSEAPDPGCAFPFSISIGKCINFATSDGFLNFIADCDRPDKTTTVHFFNSSDTNCTGSSTKKLFVGNQCFTIDSFTNATLDFDCCSNVEEVHEIRRQAWIIILVLSIFGFISCIFGCFLCLTDERVIAEPISARNQTADNLHNYNNVAAAAAVAATAAAPPPRRRIIYV